MANQQESTTKVIETSKTQTSLGTPTLEAKPPETVPEKNEKKLPTITYKAKYAVPTVPVGSEEYGLLELRKIYDLTALENDYLEELFEQYHIKDDFEHTVEFAETIVDSHNSSRESYSLEDMGSLMEQILSINPEELDNDKFRQVFNRVTEFSAATAEWKVSDVVAKLMANDEQLLAEYVMEMMQWNSDREESAVLKNRILATVMLKFRHFAPQDIEWELEDTLREIQNDNLHYKTIVALADYAMGEKTHWEKDDANSTRAQAELKKRLLELQKKELNAKAGTGKK